jgi:anti-sigma regulatory factor (Ser/Thr protein kinase)
VAVLDWTHELALEAEPMSAGLARDFVRLHLHAHDLPHLVDDIRLVVSELATNAVNHAATPFVVTLSMAGGAVRLVVPDESPTVPVRSAMGVMDINGRGLAIVEEWSHAWGVQTDVHGCKSVWASFTVLDPKERVRS